MPVRAEQARYRQDRPDRPDQQHPPQSYADQSPRHRDSIPARPVHPQPHSPADSHRLAHAPAHLRHEGAHHRSSMPSTALPKPPHDPRAPVGRLQRPAHASMSTRPSSSSSRGSSTDSSLRETSRANIRGSMPPPRLISSTTLGWDQASGKSSPREQGPETPRQPRNEVEMQFDALLDSLQVAPGVREKFATVSHDVKSSILLSTLNSNPTILSSLGLPVPQQTHMTPKVKKRLSAPMLRKVKSSADINSPSHSPQVGRTYDVEGEGFVIVASPMNSPNPNRSGPADAMSSTSGYETPGRGQSMDLPRPSTMRYSAGPSSNARPMSMARFGPSSSNGSVTSLGRAGGKGLGIAMGEQPESFIQWLGSYKGTDLKMEVARAKKLRMLLRHEATDWVASFVEQGGYKLVLSRLQDLLDVEWREEQHDDQMLYELLRCVKALSTSEIGKTALRAHFPDPFPALSMLLFSEKKPGDLASRQIILELWLFLFDLFPPSLSSPSQSGSADRPTSVRFDSKASAGVTSSLAAGQVDIVKHIRGLLVPDLPDPTKDQHAFVTQAHRPRVFKAWVGELSDICRDYFWIMCHASNHLWNLDEVDESSVERPVAPGGATGGVEFEAMNYVTMHFKLLNTLCRYQAVRDREKAVQLHQELMSSGMDRILVTLRKASTTYYPTLHLELARYVALLRSAGEDGKLPYLIGKMVGPPPEHLTRFSPDMSGGREWHSRSAAAER